VAAGPQFTDEQRQTRRDSGARVVPLGLEAFRSGEWSCLLETRIRSRGDGASQTRRCGTRFRSQNERPTVTRNPVSERPGYVAGKPRNNILCLVQAESVGCERHGASRRWRPEPAASAVPLTHRDPNI